jgi:hypothetical protein
LGVLILDVVTLGVSIMRFHHYRGEKSIPATGGDVDFVVVDQSSVIPLYAIFLLSVLCLVMLCMKYIGDRRRKQLAAA